MLHHFSVSFKVSVKKKAPWPVQSWNSPSAFSNLELTEVIDPICSCCLSPPPLYPMINNPGSYSVSVPNLSKKTNGIHFPNQLPEEILGDVLVDRHTQRHTCISVCEDQTNKHTHINKLHIRSCVCPPYSRVCDIACLCASVLNVYWWGFESKIGFPVAA